MSRVTVEEVQTQLPALLERVTNGEMMIITQGNQTVARLLPPEMPKGVPIYGRSKGKLTIHSEDDEHLKDFAEYMD